MKTIEFETEVINGQIILPIKYKNISSKKTRILLIVNDENKTSTKKNHKLKKAIQMFQEVNPFKNISNPANWQKQLRDEW